MAAPLGSTILTQIGHPNVPAGSSGNPSSVSQSCLSIFPSCLPSYNWAGYVILSPTGSGVTDVKASWTVPYIFGAFRNSCPDPAKTYDSNAVWVGLDGFTNGYVEQAGTSSDCYYGQTNYYAWYEFYPLASVVLPNAVQPGDTIQAEVSYAAGSFTTTIKDTTAHWSQVITVSESTLGFSPPMASAEFIDESPAYAYQYFLGLTPVAPITFSGATATINSVTNSLARWGAVSPTGVCNTAPFTNCVVYSLNVDFNWPGTNEYNIPGILPSTFYVKAQPTGYFGGIFSVNWRSAGP
ncbi:MAG TPA: G1 family glutamic endopeptidase [Nitrososphaerales archaeon]|nr:G1 family glutamic endopeptidase [Nitrososphaerales archaeon]